MPELGSRHYVQVVSYDAATNHVVAEGPVKPLPESLTHEILYDVDTRIRVILHVHSSDIWHAAGSLGKPPTGASIPYGTPAMAAEIQRLLRETDVNRQLIFSMGRHEDGIVAFGHTVVAGETLLAALAQSQTGHQWAQPAIGA